MRTNHPSIKKVCTIQLQPFGDVFHSTSYFKALKEFYPNATLTFLMKSLLILSSKILSLIF